MGLFDTIAKHAFGGSPSALIDNLIREAGGLSGMAERFQSAGFGDTFASWVSTEPNQPIQAAQLEAIMGADAVKNLAARVGFDSQMVLSLMAQFLPQIIDRLTPGGVVDQTHPTQEQIQQVFSEVMKGGLGGLFGRKS